MDISDSDSDSEISKKGSTYTKQQDLFIAKEVDACNAHFVEYGKTSAKFDKVAKNLNENKQFKRRVTGEQVRARFNTILRAFQKSNAEAERGTGIGLEYTNRQDAALAEILQDLGNARKDQAKEIANAQTESDVVKEVSEAVGENAMRKAMNRKRTASEAVGDFKEASKQTPRKSPREALRVRRDAEDPEMAVVYENIAKAESVKADLAREIMEHERQKWAHDLAMKKMDIFERREERAAAAKRDEENRQLQRDILEKAIHK